MKKVITLVAAAAFVLSLAGMASAAHQGRANLQTSGFIQTGIGFADSTEFEKNGGDTFVADQRVRQYFDYVASENLKATVGYEFDSVWGDDSAAQVGADNTGLLELKRANMEFTVPNSETTVKSGIQFIALPGVAMGSNPVLAGDMAGVTISAPVTDTVDMTVGYSRAYNSTANNAAPGMDTFFAALPMNQDGYSIAPFAVYSIVGQDVNTSALNVPYYNGFTTPNQSTPLQDSASAYWLGTNFEMTQMDPIGVKASFIYGSLQADQDVNERAGWYADLSVDYEMPNMTPEFFAMYSSGEDDDVTDGSETMPMIFNDGLTSKAPSMMIGDMTTLGITSAGVGLLQDAPLGLWTAGVSLKHIQLMENMTGTITASYYQGTNDSDLPAGSLDDMDNALTDEDSAWDVGVSTNYAIYESLSAICEAGYAKKDMDDGSDDEPAYRLATGLVYSF